MNIKCPLCNSNLIKLDETMTGKNTEYFDGKGISTSTISDWLTCPIHENIEIRTFYTEKLEILITDSLRVEGK